MKSYRAIRPGFTLTELLVVIAIIATMMALMIPAVQWARERGRLATCSSNLKQIGLAFQEHDVALRSFPHAGLYDPNDPTPPWSFDDVESLTTGPGRTQNYTAWGWAYQILPYLEREREFQIMASDNAHLVSTGAPLQVRLEAAALPISNYFCPTRRAPAALDGRGCGLPDSLRGAIDYAGNGGYRNRIGSAYSPTLLRYPVVGSAVHPDGTVIPLGYMDSATGYFVPERDKPGQGNLTDGASSTILAGERRFNFLRKSEAPAVRTEDNGYMAGYTWDTIRWAYEGPGKDFGDPAGTQDTRFGASHGYGCQFVFADGRVKLLKYDIELLVFQQLCSRDDGGAPQIP